MDDATRNKIFAFEWSTKDLAKFNLKLLNMRRLGATTGEISKYLDDISELKGLQNSEKFVTKIEEANTLDNFKSLAFEADRAAHFKRLCKNIVIEPDIKNRIDLKVNEEFIEQKASNGAITEGKIKDMIGKTEGKFGDKTVKGIVGDSPTKLEISAREGLGNMDINSIKNRIYDYMRSRAMNNRPNYIQKIEIFLPDGSSIIGNWDNTLASFIWS